MSQTNNNLSPAEAQLLMSQLLDGELAPADAQKLEAYLERNPEAADWLESADLSSQAAFDKPISDIDAEIAANDVLAKIALAEDEKTGGTNLLRFPPLFRYLAAAAAIAVAALVGYQASQSEDPISPARIASR